MSDAGDFSLMDLFQEEVRSHGATLNQGLLDLESDPGNPRKIEPLMRAAHSIKGAARIVNIDDAVQLAHVMEDVFVAAQEGRITIAAADIDQLLRGADLLGQLAKVRESELASWAVANATARVELQDHFRRMAQGEVAAIAAPKTIAVAAQPPTTVDEPPSPVQPPPATVADQPPATDTVAEAVVRVTAQSLNRLMGLAGESLVQARWLDPFATSLLKLKKQQDQLAGVLDSLRQAVSAGGQGDRVDSLLAEARRQSTLCREIVGQRASEFQDHAAHAEDLGGRLYREVIASRMRPFADGTGGFARLVRDMSRRLEKPVRLEITGLDTPVDRDILEKLEAPLTHLLRNSVDHGVETADVRRTAGKAESGLIKLDACHRAGTLVITVSDDGGGIDPERLRAKVVQRGLTTAEQARNLTEAELLEFLFLPGFSTASALTEYSGRGVGLDVVQTTLRNVGGSVRISTQLGKGTRFHLQMPITLSVLRAVLVDIAGETYAFPHNRIDRLINVPLTEVRSLEQRQFVLVGGQNVGLVVAAQLFDLPPKTIDGKPGSQNHDLAVVLLSDQTGSYGLIVEAFRGEQDLVVRTLDARLGKVPNLSAAAILDDGAPALIVDVEDLIRSMDRFIQGNTLRRTDRDEHAAVVRKRVLVVDDSITVRELERQLLRNHGYDVTVAVDGKDGWNIVRAERFDLVISDVDMPRMNGLELVKAIRADHALRELPVIIVSYKEREEDKLRGLEVGANYYLTKSSFHDDTFLQVVTDLIGEPPP
jgi:two-component system, chemotaxis family, sensor histidine kinase and response regulator WspE